MAKKKKEKPPVLIKIKKLRTNYELFFGYEKKIIEYIKTLPKEHWRGKKESFIDFDGKTKNQWFWIITEAKMGKMIAFFLDNAINFTFQNVPKEAIDRLRDGFVARQAKIREVLRLKKDSLDFSGENYDYLKIQPYDYQKEAIKFFEINDGVAILGDQPGVGKSQPLDSKIVTPDGWIKMGDMKINQKISHHNGKSYKVDGIFPQGICKTYKITFNDGFSTECSMDHLWVVRDVNRRRKNKGWTTKTLKELVDSGLQYKYNEKRHKTGRKPVLKWEIPMTQPVDYPVTPLVIDPYILGALIGDGNLCSGVVSISIPHFQMQIKEQIENLLPTYLKFNSPKFYEKMCPKYNIIRNKIKGKNPFMSEIKRLNLNVKSGKKFIPKNYLISGYEQRVELLRGLMDTDGSANKNRINYHTTSKRLSEDISELIQSLGGQARIKVYNRKKEGKSMEYRVAVRINICPFNLKEKKDEWWIAKRNYASRYIKNVEFLKEEQHQCISVNSPDNTYLTNNYIVTHNTLPGFAYGVKHQYKTLIICPATLKLNWRREILKFTNEKAFVFKYKPKKKSKQIAYTKEESLFHILNYESVESYIKFEYKHKCNGKMIKENGKFGPCGWSETNLKKKYATCPYCETKGSVKSRVGNLVGFGDDAGQFLKPEEYDLIVIDECHRMKEMTTGWTKIIHKSLKMIPRRILMSGTVIKSRPMEFFSTLNFIDPEEWKNSHNFGARYCAGFEDNFGWDYSGASNLDELFERVSGRFLRRLKKDVLEQLPPKTYVNIPIELSDKEFREYKKLEEETIKEIVNGVEIEKEEQFLPKLLKLKLFLGKIKANAAKDMVQDLINGGEKVVVFSDRTDVANQIYEYFSEIAVLHTGSMGDEDKDLSVVSFQEDNKIKVFCGMVIASGVGITLTKSSNLIKLGFSWSPADEEQCEDRIHRATTTADKVTITTLYCPDTIDEDIMELLNEKSQIVTKVLDNKHHTKKIIQADKSIFQTLINRLAEKNN